jgi:hypothetical protein
MHRHTATIVRTVQAAGGHNLVVNQVSVPVTSKQGQQSMQVTLPSLYWGMQQAPGTIDNYVISQCHSQDCT